MYWDYNRTLSHNCLFNFIIGDRGAGKTYGAKKRAILNFKKNGTEFIYLRRYKTEFEDLNKFFSDLIVNDEFPDDKLEVKGKKFYINDKLFGYAIALSTAAKKKSTAYPNVTLIIFDEFIIEKQVIHYLQNEPAAFQDFYITVSRYRPVIVLFLANAITFHNPYFIHYNISLPYGSNFYKRNDILLELIENPEFKDHVASTRVGKMLLSNDEQYARYAIDNQFLHDSKVFIEKKPSHAKHIFNIKYHGQYYGVWTDWINGLMYFSNDTDPSSGLTFSLTTEDHSPNTLLIKRLNQTQTFKTFIEAYKLGCVRFENQRVKAVAGDLFRMVLR